MRNPNYSRFRRGQVWFLKEPEDVTRERIESRSSVQAKSRPWLIVSIDESNSNSLILNVVPLSLSSDPNFISHVSFKMDKGDVQVIECEQIQTKSMYDFMDNGFYKFTVSDEIMTEVSFKLARQIGAQYQLPNMEVIVAVIEELAAKKAAAMRETYQSSLDDAVLDLGTKLEELFGLNVSKNATVNVQASVTEKVEALQREKLDIEESMGVVADSIKGKRPYQKHDYDRGNNRKGHNNTYQGKGRMAKRQNWTPEAKKQFLEDHKRLSREDLIKKWNISEGSVDTYVSKFRKSLEG